ncbi:MAG TPA: rhodanese-like domain-containing protein [Bryobacteraceae bacterium]|nr:rhodanese-like domain-containing protein [Bryobacteraceae bacterium]
MNRRTAVLTLALAAGGCGSRPAGKQLSPEELAKLLEHRENIFFLDVRESMEIAQGGSVPGYVNIPLAQLEHRLNEIPRDKVIVTA